MFKNIVITGTGSIIPSQTQNNKDFKDFSFYDGNGEKLVETTDRTISKFEKITGIEERRYIEDNQLCSTIGAKAAEKAIICANINKEEIDYIIVAQNFGDIVKGEIRSDMVPAISSKIKHNLKIKNPNCVAYDVIFGCPGWIEGIIQATAFIKSGMAKKCLVIGTETLSRVIDPYDRDSMIFADGAGASIIELREEPKKRGLICNVTQSYTLEEMDYLYCGKSNRKDVNQYIQYIKMKGHKIYEFALKNVPQAMKACIDQSGVDIKEINKILIHQANLKMDEAIVKRLFKLAGHDDIPQEIMPMTIAKLGNSSVATIPTLYDLILKDNIEGHHIKLGDYLLFASVGAGMNINAFMYKQ